MFCVDSPEAAKFFLKELHHGSDSCLRDIHIEPSTWIDEDGAMNFGSLTTNAHVTLQSQLTSGVRVILEGVISLRLQGLDPSGYDGIIQDLRIELGENGIVFSAYDSSYDNAFEYFSVEAKRMCWELL